MTEVEKDEAKRKWSWNQIALLLVVMLTAWSAGISTVASNRSDNAVDTVSEAVLQVQDIAFCNTQVLNSALAALNERSTFSVAASQANVDLQKAQARLLAPGVSGKQQTPTEGAKALQAYFESLTEYIQTATQSQNKAMTTPYPDADAITTCLTQKVNERQKEKETG